jgi:UDP-2,4-diacetamido-2,4,6-trideoxy-beta-L-altropyranose hydrolase
MKPLVIRADASAEIGSGHVMRCLALAEAWQDCGGSAIFVLSISSPPLEARVRRERFEITHITSEVGSLGDADTTVQIAQMNKAEWVVVDGYNFSAEYQKRIKECGLSLLCIDDFGQAARYYADIVLNQNIYADMFFYKNHEPSTRFLLGTKYALLRKEFFLWNGYKRVIPRTAKKILVTLGGSDPENITGIVIEALKTINLEGLEVLIVAGGLNPNYSKIQNMVKNLPNFSLKRNVGNMPNLMAWADLAISAGGSTSWELAFMGVPSILLPIAENQQRTVNYFQTHEIARGIRSRESLNLKNLAKIISELAKSDVMRERFSKNARKYVDGNGSFRVQSAMQSHNFRLRRVQESDCRIIWEWINDPFVRSCSFNPKTISVEDHKKWFASALVNPRLVYYIAIDPQGNPFGQVRFLIGDGDAVVSMLLDRNYRGVNLSAPLIRSSTDTFFSESNIPFVSAYIKTENERSLKAFKKAGYREYETILIYEQKAYHLMKKREDTESTGK